jgi:hypothetical protein
MPMFQANKDIIKHEKEAADELIDLNAKKLADKKESTQKLIRLQLGILLFR